MPILRLLSEDRLFCDRRRRSRQLGDAVRIIGKCAIISFVAKTAKFTSCTVTSSPFTFSPACQCTRRRCVWLKPSACGPKKKINTKIRIPNKMYTRKFCDFASLSACLCSPIIRCPTRGRRGFLPGGPYVDPKMNAASYGTSRFGQPDNFLSVLFCLSIAF